MPILNDNQVVLKWANDAADRVAFFEVLNFDTGDTAELNRWFASVKVAGLIAPIGAKVGALTVVSGTQVSMDPTGLTDASGYMMIWGSKAPGSA